MLQIGADAPLFSLVDQHSRPWSLADHADHHVLAALAKFDVKYSLGFTLLSDRDHAATEAYEVWQEKKLYGKVSMGVVRSAFLVGPAGRLEQVWYKISPKDTPIRLLEAIGA